MYGSKYREEVDDNNPLITKNDFEITNIHDGYRSSGDLRLRKKGGLSRWLR